MRRRAQEGDAEAHRNGNTILQGRGCPKDDVKAVEWWSRAAEQGNTDGQYLVGNKRMAKNAANGSVDGVHAQYRVICTTTDGQSVILRMVPEGCGMYTRMRNVLLWGNLARTCGRPRLVYEQGQGFRRTKKAVEWYRKAAGQQRRIRPSVGHFAPQEFIAHGTEEEA